MRKARYLPFLLLSLHACVENPYVQGERLYAIHCANCHMEDGSGLERLYPPLNGPSFVTSFSDDFACIVRYGLADTIDVDKLEFSFPMPPNAELNNIEISNIYNYIVTRWHPSLKPTNGNLVKDRLETCTK